ncbi:TonB-dependent receptor [Sinomicrobium soli]|uniref:TonB-dependent receptor n=1 Tax=Sinomicrobium sp. N-1-3-6 TaxID=2219864 RepID=UPI000DCC2F22|nr:TonB-dependent receptor [Sinomicrobium sp. N-1-3-6]RAV28176.1 TonB-dependent receptor [Sinomicrobium sp. N-1-3-6]
MKIFLLFIGIGLSSVYASHSSAQTRMDINMRNVTVKQVFEEIQKNSEYVFFYKDGTLDEREKVSLDVKDATLEDILHKIFGKTTLTYELDGRQVIVRKKPGKIPEPGTSETNISAGEQGMEISGTVTDSQGTPLPGANVLEKGTAHGTQTDFDGNYTLTVSGKDAVLEVSYLGFVNQEVPVDGRTEVQVALREDVSALEEVVVVGYGTQKKSDLTGAVSSLSSEDLTSGGSVSNVAQAIQGRASGVVVTQNSKAPGGSMSIRIRGANSVSSTNEPLYVVDGFPTDNGVNINPDDIASMEILKDASATAIYGSRGANGVVMITTKRGKEGISNITVNAYTSIQHITNPFDMLNGKDYMSLANALYKEIPGQENQEYGVYTPSQLESDVNTDWVEATTRNSVIQNYSIQVTGGNEKTKILTSLGFFDQDGVLKNTNFSRVSGRVNIDHKINDFLKTGVSMMAQREKSDYQLYSGNILNSNVLYAVLTYDPTVPVYNADGSFARPPGGRGDNPLANLMSRQNDLQKDAFNGTMFMEFNLAEGLTARVDAGTEIRHDQLGTYLLRESYQGSADNGVASTSDYSLTHNLFDMFLTYNREFNEKHAFQFMGGYSYEKFINERKGINVYGFSTDLYGYNNLGAASTITGVSSYKSENILASFFGRVNYTFDDRYLLTFTVRADGSSRFGEDNRWGVFPSGSFAWRVINEQFMQDQNLFSDLKFRAGYGKTGNERIGDYASYGLMSNAKYTFDGEQNSSGAYLNNTSPENSRLKWETTDQYNVGVDFSFLDNRLSFNVDAYHKKTENLLIRVNLPMYTGYVSGLKNIGAIENKGIEFGMESKNVVGEDFTWTTHLNLAFNSNKVKSLGGESDILLTSSKPMGTVSEEAYAIIREGEPLGSLFGYKYAGVLQEGETYGPQPGAVPGDPLFVDVNNDGEITSADRTIIGNATPKMTLGFTNSLTYKDFDMSFFLYGNIGNDLLNMTRMNLEWNRTRDALNRWTPDNTDTNLPRNGFYYAQYGGYVNDHFIEDASFLRLRNLTLGYTVPLKTEKVESLRVYLMGENLFTITSYSGWDPEVDTKGYENNNGLSAGGNQQAANAGAGLDFNSYPSMRSFTFGLSVKF